MRPTSSPLYDYTTIPGLSIQRAGGGEVTLFAGRPAPVDGPVGFTPLLHAESYGQMSFFHHEGEGFQLWHNRYDMQQQMRFVSKAEVPVLELHFLLGGERVAWWQEQRPHMIRPWQFELAYSPFVEGEVAFGAGERCRTLDLHFSPAYLMPFVQRYPALGALLEQVALGRQASLRANGVQFADPAMIAILQSMLRFDGAAGDAPSFLEGQVALLLEKVMERAANGCGEYCTRRDMEATVAARAILEANTGHAYTTAELSRLVGVNVSRLHACFKDLHGVTLFAFGQGLRLDHGRHLLLDTRLTVREIAEQCGYPEQANFTAAFRKRFGVVPSQLRGEKAENKK